MAYTLAQASAFVNGGGSNTINQTFSSVVTAHSVLVAFLTTDATTPGTVSFTGGGTWQQVNQKLEASGSGQWVVIGCCLDATGGTAATVTATWTGNGGFNGLGIGEFTNGGAASLLDAFTAGSTGTSTTPTDTAMTAADVDLAVSWALCNGGAAPTAGSGFVIGATDTTDIAAWEYDTTAGPGSVTCAFSLGGSQPWVIVSALFKSAEAVAPVVISARPGKTWKRRFKHRQRLALETPPIAAPDADPTQAGYGPLWRWYRSPVAPQQRPLESVPGMLDTAQLENELLGGATIWEQYNRAATHVDRRQVPQYTLRESVPGLLDQAQLEVPPPLPLPIAATHQRLPWLRIEPTQVDQSSQPGGASFDPTQAGYSLRHVWRRDPYPPTQRSSIQNPDDVSIVGTGATGAWWGVDDTAHHFWHALPTQTDPNFLTAAIDADPLILTDSSDRERIWFARPWFGLQRTAKIDVGTAPPPEFDPGLAGYGPRWVWYRPPAIPQQRERESAPGLLDTALLENELLGGLDDLTRHRGWYIRPWFGLQRAALVDQSTAPAPDGDPTQAGYGPRWIWYRPPVAPVQRDRESDPNLLLTALLEDPLLGASDDLQRHRTWHASWRLVPQQRSYPDVLQPPADPLLVAGAEWRYKLTPATHAPRWVLRLQIKYLQFMGAEPVLFQGNIVGGILPGSGVIGSILGGAGITGSQGLGSSIYGGSR